jgi:hypothetical protein
VKSLRIKGGVILESYTLIFDSLEIRRHLSQHLTTLVRGYRYSLEQARRWHSDQLHGLIAQSLLRVYGVECNRSITATCPRVESKINNDALDELDRLVFSVIRIPAGFSPHIELKVHSDVVVITGYYTAQQSNQYPNNPTSV